MFNMWMNVTYTYIYIYIYIYIIRFIIKICYFSWINFLGYNVWRQIQHT
ncbi:hypothetical protein ACMBCM_07275 [Spiroplasma sp. K1]